MRPAPARSGLVLGLAVVLGATLAVAGCRASAPDQEGQDPAPSLAIAADELDGVTAEIRQGRADWADRVVSVRILNDTEQPFTVLAATLATAHTADVVTSDPAWTRLVPVGSHRDARVVLGTPLCGTSSGQDGRLPRVHLTLSDDAGRTAELDVVPADPQGHLERVHAEDCAERTVESGATLRFDSLTTQDRDGVLVATLWLVAEPVAGGPEVTFTDLARTGLAAPVSGSSWPLTGLGDPVTAPATIGIDFLAARCDAHAVAEDKRGTFFGVNARVAGVEQDVYFVGTGPELRAQMYAYIGRFCAWGPDAG